MVEFNKLTDVNHSYPASIDELVVVKNKINALTGE